MSSPLVLIYNLPIDKLTITTGTGNYGQITNVDWGDGTIDTKKTHTYALSGTYTVKVEGTGITHLEIPRASKPFLIGCTSFGTIGLKDLTAAFDGCIALVTAPETLPPGVTVTMSMFKGATAFDGDINGWDVSSVTNMSYMFLNATSFNKPLNNWNVSNTLNMVGLFSGATAFNQPLNNWDMSNVSDMSFTFYNAQSFNQDICTWAHSNLTVTQSMFKGASAFNQHLNDWNVSNVRNMNSMFAGATSFNQDLSNWNVSNVTYMANMFSGATVFDQDISVWDVSRTTTVSGMFYNATSFNNGGNPLTWNSRTSKIITFNNMFNGATAFKQSILDWNFDAAQDLSNMYLGSNYDALLNDIVADTFLLYPVRMYNFGSVYTQAGLDSRNALVAKGWVFQGDMFIASLPSANTPFPVTLNGSLNAVSVTIANSPVKKFVYLGDSYGIYYLNNLISDIVVARDDDETGFYTLLIENVNIPSSGDQTIVFRNITKNADVQTYKVTVS